MEQTERGAQEELAAKLAELDAKKQDEIRKMEDDHSTKITVSCKRP